MRTLPAFAAAAAAAPPKMSQIPPTLPLSGRNALVTGASRGIGRGVALALATAGARVFATGRSHDDLAALAALTPDGLCVPLVCDHSDADAVRAAFRAVAAALDDGAQLDLLVNNAFAGANGIASAMGTPFWEKGEKPEDHWDSINGVGLRSNYVAAAMAARLMLARAPKPALIINVSSFGGVTSMFDPAYCAGKAANDRLIAEIARELHATNISSFTLYPGLVSTELIAGMAARDKVDAAEMAGLPSLGSIMWNAESPVYIGRVIASILGDPDFAKASRRRNGSIVIAAEAAKRYGVTDLGGEQRLSSRSLKTLVLMVVPALRGSVLAKIVPDIYVPWFLVTLFAGAAPGVRR
jgi:NAD(P)-dependent dehydrogenase (short-subunit alcohol dehydrogenase family)